MIKWKNPKKAYWSMGLKNNVVNVERLSFCSILVSPCKYTLNIPSSYSSLLLAEYFQKCWKGTSFLFLDLHLTLEEKIDYSLLKSRLACDLGPMRGFWEEFLKFEEFTWTSFGTIFTFLERARSLKVMIGSCYSLMSWRHWLEVVYWHDWPNHSLFKHLHT